MLLSKADFLASFCGTYFIGQPVTISDLRWPRADSFAARMVDLQMGDNGSVTLREPHAHFYKLIPFTFRFWVSKADWGALPEVAAHRKKSIVLQDLRGCAQIDNKFARIRGTYFELNDQKIQVRGGLNIIKDGEGRFESVDLMSLRITGTINLSELSPISVDVASRARQHFFNPQKYHALTLAYRNNSFIVRVDGKRVLDGKGFKSILVSMLRHYL